MRGGLTQINSKEEFEELVDISTKGNIGCPVIFLFRAPWFALSRTWKHKVEEASYEAKEVLFAEVDMDEMGDVAHNLATPPEKVVFLEVFHGGVAVERFDAIEDLKDASAISEKIKEFAAKWNKVPWLEDENAANEDKEE